jgi:hypothetical protein
MKLDNKELHAFLISQGINELYHANSVSTAITFINQNGLLSRGAVEEKELIQSSQSSDGSDKIHNVWNDVFVDTVDLHSYFNRQNYYGPVLFKISIDFLLESDFDIWVTKDNPQDWSDALSDEEKYFVSVTELEEKWDDFQRQKKMVTIRDMHDAILFDYLNGVVVDNPNVSIGDKIVFNESVKALKKAIGSNNLLKNKVSTRNCSNCFCKSNYLNQVHVNDIKRLFLTN